MSGREIERQTVIHQRHKNIIRTLILGLFFAVPAVGYGDNLDDISIQVIGLDEFPEEALERIPMPSPNVGGLTDIHQDIIPHVVNIPAADDNIVSDIASPELGLPNIAPPTAAAPPSTTTDNTVDTGSPAP